MHSGSVLTLTSTIFLTLVIQIKAFPQGNRQPVYNTLSNLEDQDGLSQLGGSQLPATWNTAPYNDIYGQLPELEQANSICCGETRRKKTSTGDFRLLPWDTQPGRINELLKRLKNERQTFSVGTGNGHY